MSKEEIIQFISPISVKGLHILADPIRVKSSPHSPAVKIIALEACGKDLYIHNDLIGSRWEENSDMVRSSVIQRVRLLKHDNEKLKC